MSLKATKIIVWGETPGKRDNRFSLPEGEQQKTNCSSLSGTDHINCLVVGLRRLALPYAIIFVPFRDFSFW